MPQRMLDRRALESDPLLTGLLRPPTLSLPLKGPLFCLSLNALEVEHQSNPCLHPGQSLWGGLSRTFLEVVLINGDELRDVRH